jgi:hypothetical protein
MITFNEIRLLVHLSSAEIRLLVHLSSAEIRLLVHLSSAEIRLLVHLSSAPFPKTKGKWTLSSRRWRLGQLFFFLQRIES